MSWIFTMRSITSDALRKKCYWIKSISFKKHVYRGFKSICYRISNIFTGSCSISLWINSIHAFGKKCFWFNSIFFSVWSCTIFSLIFCWKNVNVYQRLDGFILLNCKWKLVLISLCPRFPQLSRLKSPKIIFSVQLFQNVLNTLF